MTEVAPVSWILGWRTGLFNAQFMTRMGGLHRRRRRRCDAVHL